MVFGATAIKLSFWPFLFLTFRIVYKHNIIRLSNGEQFDPHGIHVHAALRIGYILRFATYGERPATN